MSHKKVSNASSTSVRHQVYFAAASSGKRSVTVWHPSVCLFRRHTHRDSPGGSMRRGQRIFRANGKDDRHTC